VKSSMTYESEFPGGLLSRTTRFEYVVELCLNVKNGTTSGPL
jgi:hypothetical protein